ncbi:MAG: DUF4389 domain-containing protein [Acidimicrobiales bacterium]
MPQPSEFPLTIQLDAPLEVARWRVIVNGIMAIPHFIVLYILIFLSELVAFISFFAILFTGNIPEGMFNFQAMVLRYQWRVLSFAGFLREPYPPFAFDMTADDPGGDPATLRITRPDKLSRWQIFLKWLFIIPHALALIVLGLGAYIAYVVAFFAVLITGKWPEGLRKFIVGVMRWGMRVSAYTFLLTDVYPPFALD